MEQISQTSTLDGLIQSNNVISNTLKTNGQENFSSTLSEAMLNEAEFVSGRLGLNLNGDGVPAQIVYFSETGEKLTTSTFSAESILRKTHDFGISLTDLQGLGEQLDVKGVGYKPYELYPGTGSDHGINFEDLISGGLGTAYDWTQDANVASKGPGARERLEAAQTLANELGLCKKSAITTEKGIDPTYFTPLNTRGGDILQYVAFNGAVASWHATPSSATSTAALYGGTTYAFHNLATAAATIPESSTLSLTDQFKNKTSAWIQDGNTAGLDLAQMFDSQMEIMDDVLSQT